MKPVEFNTSTMQVLYKKYKKYLIPAGIVLSCIIIFVVFLVPQMQEISALKDEREALKLRIQQLKINEQTAQTINDTAVSDQLDVASVALPPDKDFAGILTALSSAAQSGNVTLDNYSFDVGDLATGSAKPSQLYLELQVSITGGPEDMERLLTELAKRVPISDAETITVSQGQAQATVDFFYRPFPDLTFDPQAPIRQVSAKDAQELSTLRTWRDASVVSTAPVSAIVVPSVSPTPSIGETPVTSLGTPASSSAVGR